MHLSKQHLRSLTITVILLIFSISGLFFYTNQKRTIASDIKLYQQFLAQDAKIQTSHFDHVKGIARQLCQDGFILRILSPKSQHPAQSQTTPLIKTINENLANITSIPGISAAFIMDTKGTCILSSNPKFIGKNYGFRPYFKQAMSGSYGMYIAMGVTSKQLGIYYALPIQSNAQLLGVAVIKFSPSFFNLEPNISLNKDAPRKDQVVIALVSKNGILFSAPDYKLNSLSPLSLDTIHDIKTSKRFPVKEIVPLSFPQGTWEKVLARGVMQAKNMANQKSYYLFREPLLKNELSILHIIEDSWFDSAYSYMRHTQKHILWMLSGAIFILIISLVELVRRHQLFRKTSAELSASQNKLNLSLSHYQFIINSSPIAFWQVDTQTRTIVHANKALCDLLNSKPENIIGRSLLDFYTGPSLELLQEKAKHFDADEVFVFEIKIQSPDQDNIQIPVIQHSTIATDPITQQKRRFAFFTDLRTIKRQQAELNIFQQALAQSDNAILITNAKGNITYANQSLFEITGYKQQELLGQNPKILKSDTHSDSFYTEMWNTLTSGQKWRGRICNKNKYSTTFWQDATISPITDDTGEISHYLAIYIDISKDMKMEDQLKQALAQAKSATRAKSEFLANMSHEIRTPMNGIIGMTKLALDTSLTKEQTHFLNNVMVSATSLLALLNDILDFSKIEAKQLILEKRNFDLQKMQKNILTSMQFQAQNNNVCLEDLTDFSLVPKYIIGDELRIRQILTNLCSNALKFASQGKISLHTSLHSQNEDQINLTFSVSDTGIGIPAEKLHSIFANFSQADTSTARQYGGTGLGLSISQQLVNLMGGTIEVESTPNKGSHFHFTISLQRGTEIKTAGGEFDPKDSLNLNILLVEDNLINQEIAETVLQTLGCSVEIAGNGLEALQQLTKHNFDAIFMDVQMPVLDGFCTSHTIRAYEQDPTFKVDGVCTKRDADTIKTMPCHGSEIISPELGETLKKQLLNQHNYIIAMTANAMSGDKEKCLAVGMNAYLTKPFMPKDIYEVLHHLTPQAPLPSLPSPETEMTRAKTNSIKEQITDHLRKTYFINDFEKLEFLLQKTVETLDKDQQQLHDAWDTKNIEAIHNTSHKVKGAFLNLGLNDYATLAQSLETATKDKITPPDHQLFTKLSQTISGLITALSDQ